MVHRSLKGLVPEYPSPKFTGRNLTRYHLRDSEKQTSCFLSANGGRAGIAQW